MIMREALISLVLLINWICVSDGAVSACRENSPNFNQCIENALNFIIPSLKYGWPSSDEPVPGLDPLFLPSVNTSHTDEAMEVTLSTWNVTVTGLSDSRVYAVKTKNLYMGKMEVVLKVPEIEITGKYDSEGEIATFPVSSSGDFNITMKDVTIVCIVYMERYILDKEGRLAVNSLNLDIVPGQMYILPADSLDGNINLGKTLKVYLNENSYELYSMVKSPLMNYLSNLAKEMINIYMAQVPDNHLITV